MVSRRAAAVVACLGAILAVHTAGTASEAAGATLKVATLNLWQSRIRLRSRLRAAAHELRRLAPDVVALQEVSQNRRRPNTAGTLGRRLKMSSVYRRAARHWRRGQSTDIGVALLSARPARAPASVPLPVRPPDSERRIALCARLTTPVGPVEACNVHLSYRLQDGAVRAHQLARADRALRARPAAKLRLLLGDLNAAPDTPEVRRLIEGEPREGAPCYVDAFAAANPGKAGITWDNRNPNIIGWKLPDRRIDYVLVAGHRGKERCVTPGVSVRSARVAFHRRHRGVYASDHYGVVAELDVDPEAAQEAVAGPGDPDQSRLLGRAAPSVATIARWGTVSLTRRGDDLRLGPLNLTPTFRALYGRRSVILRPRRWHLRREGRGFRLEATANHPLVTATFAVAGQKGDPRVSLDVRLAHHRTVRVGREVIELSAGPGPAVGLRRDLRLAPIPVGTSRTDPSTPKVVLLGEGDRRVAFLGDDDFASLRVSRTPGYLLIGLEMDHAGNHPFLTTRCTRRHRPRGAGIGRVLLPGQRAPRARDASRLLRSPGERRRYRARVYVGAGFVPIWRARMPAPYRAALVFVDHADQGNLGKVTGLTFPASGGGFGGLRLPLTKTVFWYKEGRPQLASPGYQALAKRMRDVGIEVGPHSVTDLHDSRERTRRGLRAFTAVGAATWVDHAPLFNCEALTVGGAQRGGPYYVIDLLRDAGIRYAWSGLERDSAGLNILAPRWPWDRRQLFYAHAGIDDRNPPLWLFPTQWAFISRERFLLSYSDERLAELVRERGIHLAHTYLDFHAPGTRLEERTLLRRRNGAYEPRPGFAARLGAFARLRDAGQLWVTTIRDLGDHLRGLDNVRVTRGRAGEVQVTNNGSAPVRSVQLLAPRGTRVLAASGGTAPRTAPQPDAVAIHLDLAPGETRTFQLETAAR